MPSSSQHCDLLEGHTTQMSENKEKNVQSISLIVRNQIMAVNYIFILTVGSRDSASGFVWLLHHPLICVFVL